MATKKKVTDEAGDTAVEVDTEAVEPTIDDAPAEVTDLEGDPVPAGEDGIPVLLESGPVDASLATAQSILGIPSDGKMNHATKMALRQYQAANGLPPTGRFDTRTRGVMRL
jgi:hypothetical protein